MSSACFVSSHLTLVPESAARGLGFALTQVLTGVAAGTSPHPQGRQAVTAHAHWVKF